MPQPLQPLPPPHQRETQPSLAPRSSNASPAKAPCQRSRIGFKRSKPSHNIEGVSEKELRLRRQQDSRAGRKFKKRHRKDLTADEIEEIIAASKEPYRIHADIAR